MMECNLIGISACESAIAYCLNIGKQRFIHDSVKIHAATKWLAATFDVYTLNA